MNGVSVHSLTFLCPSFEPRDFKWNVLQDRCPSWWLTNSVWALKACAEYSRKETESENGEPTDR